MHIENINCLPGGLLPVETSQAQKTPKITDLDGKIQEDCTD
jgi:hypothetical protein